MTDAKHSTIFLKDYTPPSYLVTTVQLCFELDETCTRVHSRIVFYRNPDAIGQENLLELNAENLKINSIKLDGIELETDRFLYDNEILTIKNVPEGFFISYPHPNPFNSALTIPFAVPTISDVDISAWDIQGRFSERIFTGHADAGQHTVIWKPANKPSGIYLLRIYIDNKQFLRKVLLVK